MNLVEEISEYLILTSFDNISDPVLLSAFSQVTGPLGTELTAAFYYRYHTLDHRLREYIFFISIITRGQKGIQFWL